MIHNGQRSNFISLGRYFSASTCILIKPKRCKFYRARTKRKMRYVNRLLHSVTTFSNLTKIYCTIKSILGNFLIMTPTHNSIITRCSAQIYFYGQGPYTSQYIVEYSTSYSVEFPRTEMRVRGPKRARERLLICRN